MIARTPGMSSARSLARTSCSGSSAFDALAPPLPSSSMIGHAGVSSEVRLPGGHRRATGGGGAGGQASHTAPPSHSRRHLLMMWGGRSPRASRLVQAANLT